MHQVDLSIESLRRYQEQALSAWRTLGEPTPLLLAWSNIHRSWLSTDEATQRDSLGHIAVFWQELNAQAQAVSAMPLLNQFVQVSFKRIIQRIPRDFTPSLAADAASWHRELVAALKAWVDSTDPVKAELLNSLLSQYAAVFASRLQSSGRTLLSEQLPELAKAATCQPSKLLLVEPIDWDDAAGSGIVRLLELLADICAQSGSAFPGPEGWLPEHPGQADAARDLVGFWGSRAPWFASFIERYQPNLRPRYVWPPEPEVGSLPAMSGCDNHVLLVASDAACRKWLLASAKASTTIGLEVRGLGDFDVAAANLAWRSSGAAEEPTNVPQLAVASTPSDLSRIICWELPRTYFWHNEANLGGASASDAAMVRSCREAIRAQQPAAAIALFDWSRLQSAAPGELSKPYINAVSQMASFVQQRGGRPDGFTWSIVLDGAAPVSKVSATGADPQLVADYEQAIRGVSAGAYNPIVMLYGRNSAEFLGSAAALPLSQKSPAFRSRLTQDLQRLEGFLQSLAAHGFFTISVSYCDSKHDQVSHWPSFSNTWSLLSYRTTRATFGSRAQFLQHRFIEPLAKHALSGGAQAGLGAVVKSQLQGWSQLGSGAMSRSDAGLVGMWDELRAQVGQREFTSTDFQVLWLESEAAQQIAVTVATAKRASLTAIMQEVLATLGIPVQRISDFTWSSNVTSAGAPGPEEWQSLLELAAKPQPLSPEDPVLGGLRQPFVAFDALHGSLSDYCLLKDHGPDDATRGILYEHGSKSILELMLTPAVSIDEKTRLLFTLKGFAATEERLAVSMVRGERDSVKRRVIDQVWREVLSLDVMLIHMARVTATAIATLAADEDPVAARWRNRSEQLLRLLDAGGWKAELIREDIPAAEAALRRLVQLWKDFYRTRAPHRLKQ
ncbi:MAG: hypothetical protein RJA70_1655, partial [Pseudomonadota bacterium]